LSCPHCGYDGREPTENGTFRFLEDVTSYHEVKRLDRGTLYVSDNWDLYLGDHVKNRRLECRSCMREFELPKNIDIEYACEHFP
jgi:hypothetical protein